MAKSSPHGRYAVTEFTVSVSEKIGTVSAVAFAPAQYTAAVTLAHGAGSNMHHSFLIQLAERLCDSGLAVVRFNFPYKEFGRKMPDKPPVATATVERVIYAVHERFAGVPVFASGKSFGGRMTSQFLSADNPEFVQGVIFFGFPLHPPGKPGVERAAHLQEVKVPMLFLQGTRDDLARIDLITQTCSELSLATLVTIQDADHSFNRGKVAVMDLLVQRTAHWINQVCKPLSG